MSGTDATANKLELLSSDDVSRTVARIAHQIIEKTALDDAASTKVVLLGIPSGGVPLAQRIAAAVEEFSGVAIPVGSLDVTLYRDDLSEVAQQPIIRETQVPFDLRNRRVILVDDVLFTGRTVRAALEALADFAVSRPA